MVKWNPVDGPASEDKGPYASYPEYSRANFYPWSPFQVIVVKWNPVASNILASVSYDNTVPSSLKPQPCKHNHFAEMCSGSEASSYLRLINFCIIQLLRVIKRERVVKWNPVASNILASVSYDNTVPPSLNPRPSTFFFFITLTPRVQ